MSQKKNLLDLATKVKNEIANDQEESNVDVAEETGASKFIITKNDDKKIVKKKFQMEVTMDLYKELEKIKKKTGHSIVGIINMMIKHCLENLEIK